MNIITNEKPAEIDLKPGDGLGEIKASVKLAIPHITLNTSEKVPDDEMWVYYNSVKIGTIKMDNGEYIPEEEKKDGQQGS